MRGGGWRRGGSYGGSSFQSSRPNNGSGRHSRTRRRRHQMTNTSRHQGGLSRLFVTTERKHSIHDRPTHSVARLTNAPRPPDRRVLPKSRLTRKSGRQAGHILKGTPTRPAVVMTDHRVRSTRPTKLAVVTTASAPVGTTFDNPITATDQLSVSRPTATQMATNAHNSLLTRRGTAPNTPAGQDFQCPN